MLREALTSMIKANASRRIVAELTLVRMCDERLSSSPEAMLSRIAALENGAITASETAKPERHTAENNVPNAEKRPARQPKASDDDDFRGDAPSEIKRESVSVKPSVTSKPEAQAPRLTPFKQRAEVVEVMDTTPSMRMVSSHLKTAKWYVDDAGRVIMRFANETSYGLAKQFGGDKLFAAVASKVLGTSIGVGEVVLEFKAQAAARDEIDDIIGSTDD